MSKAEPAETKKRKFAPTFREILEAGAIGGKVVSGTIKTLMAIVTGLLGVVFIVPIRILEQSMLIPFWEDRSLKQEPKRLIGAALMLAAVAGGFLTLAHKFPDWQWTWLVVAIGLGLTMIWLRAWLDPGFGEDYMRIYKAVHDQGWFLAFDRLKGGTLVRRITAVLFSLLSLVGLIYIIATPNLSWMQVLYICAAYGLLWGIAAFLLSFAMAMLLGLVYSLYNLARGYWFFGQTVFHEGTGSGISFLLNLALCPLLAYLVYPYTWDILNLLPDLKEALRLGLISVGILTGALYIESAILRSGRRLWLIILKLMIAIAAIVYLNLPTEA